MPSLRSSFPRDCRPSCIVTFTPPSAFLFLLVINSLLSRVASAPLDHVSPSNQGTSTTLYAVRKTSNVRLAAVICASASTLSSFVAFYWFARMQKRFRHRLIMILIFGDLVRSFFLVLHTIVSIAGDTVTTETSYCQASGYFVHYGTETSDYAVLAIALHNAIQVFRPSFRHNSDGLYPYRHYVYVGAIVIPATMAALAFINPHWGYMSQGAFCSLPLRPFWYRLALAWIPRYAIAIAILGLAIAIYVHIGFEFRLLSVTTENTKQDLSTTDEAVEPTACADERRVSSFRRASSIISMINNPRRTSAVTSLGSLPEHDDNGPIRSYSTRSMATGSRRPSPLLSRPTATPNQRKAGVAELQNPSYDASDGTPLPMVRRPTARVNHQPTHHRSRLHRQLRLLFIYPIAYILMWLIPFVYHCMNYFDYWAAHPLYWLSLSSAVSFALMGTADCLVFTLRERPWRHIDASDGSFFGSFICWRTGSDSANGSLIGGDSGPSQMQQRTPTEANPETPRTESEGGWISSVARVGRSVRTGGSSDMTMDRAELARTRLEMEKEDRRATGFLNVEDRRTSRNLDIIESAEDKVGEDFFSAVARGDLKDHGVGLMGKGNGASGRAKLPAKRSASV